MMNSERKKILKKKLYILIGLAALGCIGYFAVIHYMYVLDSYLYGLEFHVMFFKNNIRSGNVMLLSEYFRTLGPVAGFPNLLLAEFINHYILLYAAPSLAISLAAAFGKVSGFLLCLIGSSVVALVSYGLGRFLLGDILSSFNIPIRHDWRLVAALGTLFAIPMLTILCPAVLASFFRVRISIFLIVMFSALIIRSVLPVAIPFGGA